MSAQPQESQERARIAAKRLASHHIAAALHAGMVLGIDGNELSKNALQILAIRLAEAEIATKPALIDDLAQQELDLSHWRM